MPAVDPRLCGPLFDVTLLKASVSSDKYRTGRNKRKPLGGVEGSCVITLPHLQSTGLPLPNEIQQGVHSKWMCHSPQRRQVGRRGDVTFS
ncbi:hypothetical protein CEXT_64551 [Caerostris extrusa]|uniref:Uncharacterized protein n=1 Tax=Caerostris extrusa TaxID=172846 RepID=A0AAV4R6F3_CAEEX|nr:hypothetical protein CEXT_64551 [Caerostris extrusa]